MISHERTVVGFEDRGEGPSHRTQAASRSWRGQEMDFPIEPLERNTALPTLNFNPAILETHFGSSNDTKVG